MPIAMHCPNPECGKASRLPDDARGRWARCPACGHKFQVPTEPPSAKFTQEPVLAETLPTTPPSRKPTPSTQATLPARIGRFIIKEKLGAGAFGAVYRALDPHLKREVALKVPHPGVLHDPHLAERFLREGKAAAGLHHPHIVPIYDAGQDGSLHYLATAFIPGQTLAVAVAVAKGPLDPRRAAEVVRQLAEAVAYAHGQGVVHRDIKPANVLLDERGEAHLADFGLAHRADEGGELTREGAVMGTPAYMAPEQAAGQKGKPLPASDQYALGAVLYELLTGEAPFSGPPAIVLYNVIHQEPEPPGKLNPQIPPELEAVCLKVMAKRAEDRYADCGELATELRRWLDGEPVKVRPPGVAERCLRWLKREPKLAVLAVLTVVCMLIAAGVATSKAHQLGEQRTKTAALAEQAAAEERRAAAEKRKAEEQNKAAQGAAARGAKAVKAAEQQRAATAAAVKRQRDQARLARKAEQDTKNQERNARQLLYRAHLEIAQRSLGAGNWERAYAALARHFPQPGQDDLRGADWDDLWIRLPAQQTARGHRDHLSCLSLAPDGTMLASGSADHTLRLWRSRRREQLVLKGHTGWVSSVAFSPDGKRIVSGSRQEVKVWDAQTGQEALTLKGYTSGVHCVAFSPDGKRIVSGSGGTWEGEVKVWDAQTGQQTLSLRGHTSGVHCVAFSPDGKRIASGSGCRYGEKRCEVKVWDAQTGQQQRSLKAHTALVSSVCFSPDGKRIASGSWDQTVKVWDAQTGQQTLSLKGHTRDVRSVAFSPDGKRIVSASHDTTVKLWDARTGQEILSLKRHTGGVSSVAFSPDGQLIASGSSDKTVKVWDAQTGQQTLSLKGHTSDVRSVAFSPDGQRIASASGGYDRKTRKDWGEVKVWDVDPRLTHAIFPAHTDSVMAVAFNHRGTVVASGGVDKKVRLRDRLTGKPKAILDGHSASLTALAFCPDDKLLASAADQTVILWDTTTLAKRAVLKGGPGRVRALAFNANGTLLATGGSDTKVRLWDAKGGTKRASLAGHKGAVVCLAFRPDGQTLASGSDDGIVKLWDVSSGKERMTLARHPGPVRALAFTPDGRTLATGCTDATVRLWDVLSGKQIATFAGDKRGTWSIVFSADGKRLTAAGPSLEAKSRDVPPLPLGQPAPGK